MITLNALIFTLVVSLIAGAIASVVMSQKNSIWGNLLLGFCGTVVGDFIDETFGFRRWGFVSEIIMATLCAILVIWLWRSFVSGPRRRF